MQQKEIEAIRYRFWLNGIIPQHDISAIKKNLEGMFTYSDIKLGNIKKNEGNIVIINLKPVEEIDISFKDYFTYTHLVDRIETKGIYTNIYWSRKFYQHLINYICNKKTIT